MGNESLIGPPAARVVVQAVHGIAHDGKVRPGRVPGVRCAGTVVHREEGDATATVRGDGDGAAVQLVETVVGRRVSHPWTPRQHHC